MPATKNDPFAALFGGGEEAEGLTREDVGAIFLELLAENKENKMVLEDQDSLLDMLAAGIGKSITSDSPIMRHKTPPHTISLSEDLEPEQASVMLQKEKKAQEQVTTFSYPFDAAYDDVLVALYDVMRNVYRSAGRGLTRFGFFGEQIDPEKTFITIGLNDDGSTIVREVPCSRFEFPAMGATFDFDDWTNEYGVRCLKLYISAKARYANGIQAVFEAVRMRLKTHSIYRGHVLELVNGQLKHVRMKPAKTVVYSVKVQERLDDSVIGKITASQELRAEGRRDDFRVILFGDVGTGKSEALKKVSVLCENLGITVIKVTVRNTKDISVLKQAYNLGLMYGPCVLLAEDIDGFFPMSDIDLSELLNLFDGLNSNTDVSLLMTTNYLDRIPGNVTRAPRITGMIEIGMLDKQAVEQIMREDLEGRLADDVDFDEIWPEIQNYSPSFVHTAFDEADSIRIQRNKRYGTENTLLTTEDLVRSAMALDEQHNAHRRAIEAKQEKVNHLALAVTEFIGKLAGEVGFVEMVKGWTNNRSFSQAVRKAMGLN